jgi:acyl carrier protein
MNENDLFEQITQFVEKERWGLTMPFSRNTELLKDLKLWGDDASEFIVAFSKQFDVDVSEFDFDKYFYPEGDLILPAIFDFILRRKRPNKAKITLGDLERAVTIRKLA